MKLFDMQHFPASCYSRPLMMIMMMMMMTNMTLASDARVRTRSHICTSIIPMIPTHSEEQTFHVTTQFCQPSVFSCLIGRFSQFPQTDVKNAGRVRAVKTYEGGRVLAPHILNLYTW
jgi:hypothetical protein